MNKKSIFVALADDLGLRRRSEVWARRLLTVVVLGLLFVVAYTSLQTLAIAEQISVQINASISQ